MKILLPLLTFFIFLAAPAIADERIISYDVSINVETTGDLMVEEKITVNVEGLQIKRGIFRDLPVRNRNGDKTRYNVLSVLRNGTKQHYQTEREGNAFRVRIGDANRMLDHGLHEYIIQYRVKKQIRFFEGRDELYWNITGSYWDFPIEQASARISLPAGATIQDVSSYTGSRGSTGSSARYFIDGNEHVIKTINGLPRRNGLTVSLSFDPGLIQRPSLFHRLLLSFVKVLPLIGFAGGSIWIWRWLHNAYLKVGVDPEKAPVTVQFDPPEDISAAAAAFIVSRSQPSNQMLLAALLQLGIGKAIRMDVEDKKHTTLTKGTGHLKNLNIGAAEEVFFEALFANGNTVSLDGSYDPKFTSAYRRLSAKMKGRYGRWFKWNHGYLISAVFFGIGLSVLTFFILGVIGAPPHYMAWLAGGCVALIALYSVYAYLLPAPTKKGYRIRNHLLGFREYLKTAEAQYLNMGDASLNAPPVMSAKLYERFLPYAVALGVEKPWTKYFETVAPKDAEAFRSSWTDSTHWNTVRDMQTALPALSSSLGAARVAPSSNSSGSSGFSGGGFSGGGGGGGGGGGW